MIDGSELGARLDALREAPGYRNYEVAREHVLRMQRLVGEQDAGLATPSAYWSEELENFEYMLDASPLIVDKLAQHTFHVTGIRAYEYRTHKDRLRARLHEKLRALEEVAGGLELFVPEPRELGGFGFEYAEGLTNLDTLKYWEVLIALQRAALLDAHRADPERRVVWEIGAGWGGFPYRFKTLCPNTTYVISDFPELYLFSATYLMTLFPEARCRFYGDGTCDRDDVWDDWESYDFIFLPHTRIDLVTPPRLDLTMNMVSFQEMTTDQVEAYVSHAHGQGCAYLYSLNRERSLYNPELRGVSRILDEYYWPHEIDVLPVSYVHMMDRVERPDLSRAMRTKLRAKHLAKGMLADVKREMDYRHLVGWRRIVR